LVYDLTANDISFLAGIQTGGYPLFGMPPCFSTLGSVSSQTELALAQLDASTPQI